MQKQHRLRWKPQDSTDLQRAINKFNRKITRLEKTNPELREVLPEKAKYGFYKDVINTRYDLNREIKTLERFSNPGAENLQSVGVNDAKITKWQLQESKRRAKTINRLRAERLEERLGKQKVMQGKPLGYTQAQMGLSDMELRQYRPINITTEGMTQQDVSKKWKTIVRQSSRDYFKRSDYLWRDNYIKSLEDNFGSTADEVIDKIRDMDIDKFLDTMYSDTEAGIQFNYPGSQNETIQRLAQLYDVWGLDYTDEMLDELDEYEM